MSEPEKTDDPLEAGDLFYHGVVARLFPKNNMGIIRTESGREIAFSYTLVVILGGTQDPNDLKEGQRVGYDLGWTSNGLRVTKIKIYPQPAHDVLPSGLERQGGQGQELPPQQFPDDDSQ